MIAQVRLPRVVRLLDVAVVTLVLLGIWIAVTGGTRVRVGADRLSLTSPYRPLLLAVALLIVRHLRASQPNLLRRLVAAPHAVALLPQRLGPAWPIFLTSRLAVLFVGVLAVFAIGYPERPPIPVSPNEIWNLLARWDSTWYLSIAKSGYEWDPNDPGQQSIAFFPAFPMLMWVGAEIVTLPAHVMRNSDLFGTADTRRLLAGMCISLAAFAGALAYLLRLARAHVPERQAVLALGLLAAYPFAVFFSVPYSEALFLLAATGAFVYVGERDAVPAAGWGLLAGLTRPNGAVLTLPLAILALQSGRKGTTDGHHPDGGSSRLSLLAAAAMPVVGLLLFSAYVFTLTGNPFTWASAQTRWGRNYEGVVRYFTDRYVYIADHGLYEYVALMPIDVLNVCSVLLCVAMLWPVAKRLGFAYAAFVVLYLGPAMAIDLPAIGRMTSVLFPVFLALAVMLPERWTVPCITLFAVLQGFAAVVFFTARPIY